ncbi:bifunctional 2-polyprenyl-6-hydroxyphenol methylase/3-demethylubiquinol 3-O-methyltransferase UbiG [Rickettsia conorii]|uniref:Ubiquinone biosynthesis O-methyltransferase n=1 Tax=Rickettsia conorii (strain ATCC VR-613 / Malish 7) TaxID=272944 RepID=UBIG_RICCN|nr:bifunctional 2-polyprenyl-6-hydroxyphenol methylase/3-demethylubiquinol 3-O-methyltransferase UbiG [Rickettsia conorii]Q92H07.1 RecName: Full=Ubiquinone biosynthesis O-methyltransferase; AltName: Full=2-polyprenyl-6-hydroxyphenol methylase; AltName: Full=3-demethylubiquinone 3-O-methyltransferase [Rickettsia conorii str. Malish 7]AAL03503.1 3-demethylubiquinone-9 3-methyltransferase [Rickettsia conorii str. Malish 7]
MSSIDKKELEKFEKISHNWWNKDGEFGILHRINPIRLEYIIEKITTHYNRHLSKLTYREELVGNMQHSTAAYALVREDASSRLTHKLPLEAEFEKMSNDISKLEILDVGCGGGLIATPLAAQGFNVTAIDALQSNIETATAYAKENGVKINYLQSTIEELDSDKLYDVVICLEVIEHVENVQQFILNLVKHIKPNGMAIISTINRTKKAYILGIIVAEYILGWVPKNTHDYSKFLKPLEIYEMLTDTKIEIKELKGLVYDPAKNEWKLSDDIDVNYFMCLGRKSMCYPS